MGYALSYNLKLSWDWEPGTLTGLMSSCILTTMPEAHPQGVPYIPRAARWQVLQLCPPSQG